MLKFKLYYIKFILDYFHWFYHIIIVTLVEKEDVVEKLILRELGYSTLLILQIPIESRCLSRRALLYVYTLHIFDEIQRSKFTSIVYW